MSSDSLGSWHSLGSGLTSLRSNRLWSKGSTITQSSGSSTRSGSGLSGLSDSTHGLGAQNAGIVSDTITEEPEDLHPPDERPFIPPKFDRHGNIGKQEGSSHDGRKVPGSRKATDGTANKELDVLNNQFNPTVTSKDEDGDEKTQPKEHSWLRNHIVAAGKAVGGCLKGARNAIAGVIPSRKSGNESSEKT